MTLQTEKGGKWIMQESLFKQWLRILTWWLRILGWMFAECGFVENQIFLGKTKPIVGLILCEAGMADPGLVEIDKTLG